jgi:hypothetical protein
VVAEAPTFQVGDEWRYSGGNVRQVVGFEGDYVITVSKPGDSFCKDCRYFMSVLDAWGGNWELELYTLK